MTTTDAIGLPTLPEKYFYTIGDVCKITGTKPHVLRYWESQFKALKPARRYSGHRKYTQREVDIINRIKHLVIDRKFTLEGASKEINRQLNRPLGNPVETQNPQTIFDTLRELKGEVEACLKIIGEY